MLIKSEIVSIPTEQRKIIIIIIFKFIDHKLVTTCLDKCFFALPLCDSKFPF